MKQEYDVVVIGAGSGGLTAAIGAAKIGKRALLVEREHLGGECTNTGCVPSKALLHIAKRFYEAEQTVGTGAKSEAFRTSAFTYVQNTIQHFLAHETPETFQQQGITVIMGEARFIGRCSIQVGETEYQYKTAIIATGSSPRTIAIPGLDQEQLLTNQNFFDQKTVPENTLVIGAGPIGFEMGQALAMLGSNVTIATIDTEFARLDDPAIRPILAERFAELGITIQLQAYINRVEENVAIFDIKNGDEVVDEVQVTFDKILLTVGRVPNLPDGLKTAGIAFDARCVMVDTQYRTSNKYVYAIGDVAQRLKFTHTADDTARQVIARIASKGFLRLNNSKAVPKVTYTSPEIAQVGLSWNEAVRIYTEERLMRIEVPFDQNDRAVTDQAIKGILVVIVRRLNGAILGAHIIGPSAGELITTFTLAIDEKISLWRLQRLIYAYPTYSLIIKRAGDLFVGRQLAELKIDIIQLLRRGAPKLIAGLFWATLFFSFQHYRITGGYSYQDVLFQLLDFFTTTMWGPLVYMILYVIRPLILFPATLLTALSGALFGLWWGIFYTIIGENASANFAYWIGRFFSKDWRLEDSVLGKWIEPLRKNSFETVLLMRLFYVPFDLTNYGAGVIGAKWKQYFIATLIGILPGLTTFVALGAAVDIEEFKMDGLTFNALDPAYLALSVTIFTLSLILSRNLKRWKATE